MTAILYDATRTVKSTRRFGAGIARDPYANNGCHYGSLALPRPLPWVPTTHKTTATEQAYELAYQAVAAGRASWVTAAADARRELDAAVDEMFAESEACRLIEAGLCY